MAVLRSRNSDRRSNQPVVSLEANCLVGRVAVDSLLTEATVRGLWLIENLMALMAFSVAKSMRVRSGRDGRDVVQIDHVSGVEDVKL